jgi:hypothetical protein
MALTEWLLRAPAWEQKACFKIPIRAKERNRAPRSREELTVLIDRSVVEEALAAP